MNGVVMESASFVSPHAPPAGGSIESRIVLMSYSGGLIGMFSQPHRALEAVIRTHNAEGYRLMHVLPGMHGAIAVLVQLFCLCFTLMIWAPIPGQTLIFERVR
jgi:hypothetical protein